MYYDAFNKVTMPDAELKSMGLENASNERLAELGIFKLEIIKQEIEDPTTQGLQPFGEPYPSNEDPYLWIQQLVVFNFLDLFKAQKIDVLAQRRWDAQTSNLIFEDGTIFKTTPDDVNRLATTLQTLQGAGEIEIDFKAESGWITTTVDSLKDVHDTIAIYIEACFSNERRLSEAIDAAKTLDELNAVDIQDGWPPNAPEPEEMPDEEETPDAGEPGIDGENGTSG